MAREIVCNKCGKKFDIWDAQEGFSIYRRLGYGTRYDGEDLELDLCCECMDKLIEECVISPIVEHNYDIAFIPVDEFPHSS